MAWPDVDPDPRPCGFAGSPASRTSRDMQQVTAAYPVAYRCGRGVTAPPSRSWSQPRSAGLRTTADPGLRTCVQITVGVTSRWPSKCYTVVEDAQRRGHEIAPARLRRDDRRALTHRPHDRRRRANRGNASDRRRDRCGGMSACTPVPGAPTIKPCSVPPQPEGGMGLPPEPIVPHARSRPADMATPYHGVSRPLGGFGHGLRTQPTAPARD
jgi:hypothetical protein